MKDKMMSRWSAYEPFFIHFNGYKVADIVITSHALSRWTERVEPEEGGIAHICAYLWDKLKNNQVQPYYSNEKDVHLIDGDLVMVAEFVELKEKSRSLWQPASQNDRGDVPGPRIAGYSTARLESVLLVAAPFPEDDARETRQKKKIDVRFFQPAPRAGFFGFSAICIIRFNVRGN